MPATPSKRLALLQLAPALAPPNQAARPPPGHPGAALLARGVQSAPAALTVSLTAPCSRVQPLERAHQDSGSASLQSTIANGGFAASGQGPHAEAARPPQLPTLSAPLRTWEPPRATGAASSMLTPGSGGGGGGSAVLRGFGSNGFTVLAAPPPQQRGASPPAGAHAGGAPPAGAPAAPGGRCVTSGDLRSPPAAQPGAAPPMRVNRRNIVQRLAELGSPPQQQVTPGFLH